MKFFIKCFNYISIKCFSKCCICKVEMKKEKKNENNQIKNLN